MQANREKLIRWTLPVLGKIKKINEVNEGGTPVWNSTLKLLKWKLFTIAVWILNLVINQIEFFNKIKFQLHLQFNFYFINPYKVVPQGN